MLVTQQKEVVYKASSNETETKFELKTKIYKMREY